MQADVQQAIERAKQQLEQMIDLNPEVMLLVDAKGMIRRANAALLRLLKISSFKDVIGRHVGDVFGGSTEVEHLVKSRCAGSPRCETDVNMPGIGKRSFRFTVVGGGKDVELSVVVVSDVSSEKAMDAEQAQEHKKEAVQALAGAMMHRINQPLTVIVAQAHLMRLSLDRDGKGRERLDEGLQTVASQAVEIAGILEQARRAEEYVTEPYVGGVRIFDIARSSGPAPVENSCASGLAGMKGRSALMELMRARELQEPGCLVHGERTVAGSAILARRMGMDPLLDPGDLETCAMAHDIGKIGIPLRILQSTCKLSDDDMNTVKRHAEIGGVILDGLHMSADAEIVRSHHERHDGAGYPQGLKGDAIPLAARIVAVADVFDAMRSGRSYHPQVPLDETVRTIRSESGTHFHPAVVEAFSMCYKELEESRTID